MTEVRPDARNALEKLLASLFTQQELRHFVMVYFSSGQRLAASLPVGPVSLEEFSLQVVSLLERHGLLDQTLFYALIDARPARSAEIQRVRDLVLGPPPPQVEPASTPSPPAELPVRPINEIFWTLPRPGVEPTAPDQLTEITDRMGFLGEGLVVDGPSGIGKSTAVKMALERSLGRPLVTLIEEGRVYWLQAGEEGDRAELERRLSAGARALRGILVVDDFHLLAPDLRTRVAALMKSVADSAVDAKVVVIGINPAGLTLTRGLPDLSGRFAIVSMGRQPDARVEELIQRGERAANIQILHRDRFVRAARGSFFTAQLLCLEAALQERVLQTSPIRRTLVTDVDGLLVDRVLAKLRVKFHEPLVLLASHGRRAPPEGATLALLWMMARSSDTTVSLDAARRRFPTLREELDWLLSSKLATFFEREPSLSRVFFYNRDAGMLSAEDPQLGFYLEHLRWPALSRDAGLGPVEWSPELGPVFPGDEGAPVTPRSPLSPPRGLPRSLVLHLSDLHLGGREQALVWYDQLFTDLRVEQKIERLDALVISGDVSNRADPLEYEAAAIVLRGLRDDFGLDPSQCVLVPGNHDLSWDQSRVSYRAFRRGDFPGELVEGQYWDAGPYVEVPDPDALRERFRAFSELYFAVRAEVYSLDYEGQATLHHLTHQRLLFLGLNSSWRIDHLFKNRADIHSVALGRALRRIAQEPAFQDSLKIAVWHHPIRSPDEDRLRDTGFVERLTQAGFRFALHGHIHRPQQELFRYDVSSEGRRLDILGAGTAGAHTREWQPGYPLQYQLLEIEGGKLTVRSRRREEPLGAWKPDARFTWRSGDDPRSWYEIQI